MATSTQLVEPISNAGRLCLWINSITLGDVPDEIRTRAKYPLLDGVGCALVGAHLPWSTKAANAIIAMESPGPCSVFGRDTKISPLSAALINSTFIQGFELDDWHSEAPLHSNGIILPSLFAAISSSLNSVSGLNFLLAYLVGLEVGPRVGNALYGIHMLTMGWHSGAVFGPSVSAASVSKLLSLPPSQIEDALGIACTQACGLISAQYETKGGYVGIKNVYERPYGGFLDMFTKGNGKEPHFQGRELVQRLGEEWKTKNVKAKPYSAMAATHGTIDCMRKLQKNHLEDMRRLDGVESIQFEMGEVSFQHGGFEGKRPLTSIGAQMSASYVAVTQMVDGEVLPPQFREDMLDRVDIWKLVDKAKYGKVINATVEAPRGVSPDLTNEEIVEKWRGLMRNVTDDERMEKIEQLFLNLESCKDIMELSNLLAGITNNPIA